MTSSIQPTRRAELLQRLSQQEQYDLLVIGGGATGLGTALDAASRGLSVVLLESHDFAKGSSSRATKLVHGGVRYLAQGNFDLVREALRERRLLLDNAPHLARPLPFVMPAYSMLDLPWYGTGLKLYDVMAGEYRLGRTEMLSKAEVLPLMPTINTSRLRGGVKYWDGQFDDARLALALARTAATRGALVLNYCPVRELVHRDGKVVGAVCEDAETGTSYTVNAHCVINATGPWVDALRNQDAQALGKPAQSIITPSQGVHIVVDQEFLPTDHALLVPKTADGRVLFALPWLGKVILGTTDTLRFDLAYEPHPLDKEIDFILTEIGRYLHKPPTRADVRSIWVGLRPLVTPPSSRSTDGKSGSTQGQTGNISREHLVVTSSSGLVTVTGGKWTTYRAMAEDVLQTCFDHHLLREVPAGSTTYLPLVGAPTGVEAADMPSRLNMPPGEHLYGTEASAVRALPGADRWLADGLSEAMVRFAVRYEYARTVEDILARRSRLLFLDARKAAEVAPEVAVLLQEELSPAHNIGLDAFVALAQQYILAA